MELLLGRRKRSPVLLAVIFITFFHSVLSRHRIRHYKDRFKRQQGAHLYLPESFVTEGDEGREDAGPWLEWSEPSPCSRTCGGGVSTQYRQCQDGYICRGASRRHFSCNTQDCPDTGDFRAQQCSEYDEVAFENEKYQWIPYTKGPNPCELNCMPKGQRFYYRHAPQVIDGTRCTDDKLDVCVNGKCQPVGCDMMLGSNLTEDECRICGGDGSTCNTIRNTLDLNDLQMKQGYNDILLIPAGATNIAVEEVAPSNNYLAVRNTSGYYYLNGNWRIDFPRSIEFAGSKFHYERFPQEFAAPDKIYALGPIDEPLFIVLLYQDTVVPVQYKYSLPTNVQPGDDHETYAWTFDEYTPCTATCGGGIQYRNVSCAGRRTLDPVDEILCDAGRKPETSRRCNEVACEAQWVPHLWSNCSVPCGEEGGIQTREVSCQQIVSNGYPSLVEESQCQGPKPPQQQTCNKGKTCASWHLGPWKPCDHLCGDGKQTRQVTCYIKDENGKIQILDDAQCEALEDKPAAEQDCFVRPCEGVDWITSEWSGCDNVCGLNNETRRVFCATAKGQIYGDELCDLNQKPETIRGCEKSENETCNFMWYASQWSECSAKCGVGIQTRTLFCGLSSSEGVKKVENEKCDQSKNFETIRNCTGNTECDGEWFSGPWTECSKACGGGERSKKVVCIKGNEVVDDSHCDPDAFIIPREDCNEQPCTKDSIMPLDKKTSAALEKEESEKPTSKMPPTTESVTETGVTGKESDGTESMSASDISELTKSFEFTTEPQSEESGKEGEENYEIVPADTCDDGEWVEVAVKEVLIDEASAVTETTIDFSEPSGSTTTPLEPDYSIYDTMMSDGTTMEDTAITGSGDGASSLSSTQEEGSGSEPSSIVTDDVEPSVSYISSSMVFGSTESETGSTTTEGISESPSTTIESSETSTEVSASSEATTSTGTETGTTITEEPMDVSSTTAKLSEDELSSHECQAPFDACEIVKRECPSRYKIYVDENECFTCKCGETASSETVEGSTETPTTTESSTTTVTSESSESSTSDTTIDLSTVTETATSGSSETSESSSSDTTIDLSTVTETITSESSESTQTTESSTSDTTTDMSTVTETTTSGSSETTESVTSDATTVDLSTITESTETIEGSESTTSEGTTESTTSGSTIGSTEESGSTTEVGSTATDSSTVTSEGSTTEVISTSEGSTETGGSTQSFTESTTEVTSTTSGSSEESTTTESGIPGYEMSTTESTGSTMETMETGASESSTEFTGSTTEIDIFSTTPTETDLTTTLWPTTHVTEIFKKRQRMCKRRKIMQCQSSKYGCCWDNIHAAAGPFDKGCPTPKTCKESTYGCCPDGVSAALGPKNRGCPSSHCNETLFGCCWDKKTPAEGNDDEGCPPKPPACVSSEWGCCKDNITEAKGPSQKGCEPDETTENEISTTEAITEPTTLSPEECKTTDYGCCPDGTPAKGPQYQGCNLPCASSTYGCCPDQQNPAHGYRGEGCCLNTPFGCCSDGVTAARGANGEGCDCQSSTYGCCPDRVTPAQGYNNEGCGCRYSQYKCCPDELTAASGPNFEGCSCHTFQFGCCPDGVTVAEGPQQQGCDCRLSEFGCCSDEVTAATGPDGAGCSCAQTKYGCCLDGVSEAKGDNFAGCEEIPVDRQGACSLPNIRGPCRNFTVKWFYDIKYGGCSRFWYGGCDGNENRFKTKEECEGVCVKPQGIERCNLPKVNGSCDGYFLKWYYDKEMRQCSQFAYSGCLGNDNKFDTREECAELCSKDVSADPCEQTKSEGPCRGQFRRFFFDKESGDCQEFIYGGCRGNSNNFVSREACKLKCATPGKKRDYCTLPKAEGNCTAREPRWHYGAQEQRCLPFYYTGCHGNKNNFNSEDACEENCPKEVAQDMCHLPAHIGECGNYVTRWYWDTRYKRCSQFYWGGCGGNANNFQTAEECERSCLRGEEEVPPPPPPPTAPSTSAPVQEPQTDRVTQAEPAPHTARVPTIEEICAMRPDRGPCTDDALHYYYDGVDGVCKNFTYGGCGGNYNNFENEEICLQYCGSVRALPPVYTTQAPLIIREPLPENSRCYEQFDPGNCTYQYELFYYDRNTDSCNKFIYSGCGGSGNQFYSEEDCLRQCGEFRGQDICNLDMDPGPCYGAFTKYYFDKNSGTCREFSYGGCKGNANRFSLAQECEAICGRRDEPKPSQQPAEVCQLPADQGSCADPNHKRWYFDNTQGECKAFIYSGCGGNYNNFKTFQACLDFCKDFLPHSESPIVDPGIVSSQKCQEKFEECSNLRCPYGVEAYVDENDCNGCRCRDPCRDVDCPENTKCGIDLNRNRTSQEDAEFVAVCREINKSGQCPAFSTNTNNDICDNECTTDADCTLHYKCCTSSCGFACLEPQKEVVEVPAPQPEYTTMSSVEIYSPPKIDVEIYEPEVSAMLGDQAILNCAVSGNPNPNIVWQKDNVIIDGTQPRYRIRLDQTLQIITIHKTDAGVYVCTADNKIGKPIRNEIRLEVVDPSADRPVSILNGQDPELLSNHIIASFNSPASLQCYALGWPLPAVTWWKNEELIPLKNREFEVTKDYALLIHSIQLHNLGVYTCQAYNGIGQAASWSVTVKAKGPYFSNNPADVKYMQYVVNPPGPPTVLPPPLPTVPPTTQNWERPTAFQRPTPQPYIPPVYSTEDPNSSVFDPNEIYPQFPDGGVPDSVVIVPVRANITSTETRYPTGSTVQIPCQVDGYPLPQVQWYKDEVPLYPNANERISESATHTLTIKSADKRDSGRYKCEATNQYSKAMSSLDVSIEGMYIDPSCTDNQFFANCKLIVRANFCNHKYYAKFCCRSCTEAGQLRADNKQSALDTNLI